MDDCWVDQSRKDWEDGDSSDEDFVPFLQLRYISLSSYILCSTNAVFILTTRHYYRCHLNATFLEDKRCSGLC